jgi:hypothetical protein
LCTQIEDQIEGHFGHRCRQASQQNRGECCALVGGNDQASREPCRSGRQRSDRQIDSPSKVGPAKVAESRKGAYNQCGEWAECNGSKD